MIDPKTLKPGDWLWNKQRTRMGNTAMSRVSWFRVEVISIEERGARVSWNGNPAQHWPWRQLEKLQKRRRIDGKLVGAKP